MSVIGKKQTKHSLIDWLKSITVQDVGLKDLDIQCFCWFVSITSPDKVPDLEHDPDLEQLFQIRVQINFCSFGTLLETGGTFVVVFLKYKIFAKNVV